MPSPSSVQTISWRRSSIAGTRRRLTSVRQRASQSRSGGAKASSIRPRGRPAARDGGVGVRHRLGDDLDEVDPALGEVLAKVVAADAAVADGARVGRHGAIVQAYGYTTPCSSSRHRPFSQASAAHSPQPGFASSAASLGTCTGPSPPSNQSAPGSVRSMVR
jgi:hypothetical protein